MQAQPGWYPDPEVPYQQHYWDGWRWTEHTRPSSAEVAWGQAPVRRRNPWRLGVAISLGLVVAVLAAALVAGAVGAGARGGVTASGRAENTAASVREVFGILGPAVQSGKLQAMIEVDARARGELKKVIDAPSDYEQGWVDVSRRYLAARPGNPEAMYEAGFQLGKWAGEHYPDEVREGLAIDTTT